ncbi:lysoplasmalogenase [Aliiglaciecola sp. CAU 1673]|uniref:lysoplasmalogenase n=1 Tax=Aliiglaciecola sp. CAU 1673 TaxID=3032595 RepID=UPI0023DA79CD|nr:lysoplasmalogenase [Aliiglaciecola sp. CAU 1673]MDF2178992.1 lysoplasmalogenase [Aliiglaciecola sp. CAU 1673]
MKSPHWNLIFAGTSLFYLISLTYRPYPLDFLFKALPILWLMLLVARNAQNNKHLLLLALGFSACGDILLALPLAQGFLLGLGAFLLAQLTYFINFMRFRHWQGWKIAPLTAVAVFALLMLSQLLPQLDSMRLPVLIYMLVICAMASGAILAYKSNPWLLLGAASFLLSDALLAWNYFIQPFDAADHAVMLTYYLAQFGLVNGALRLRA